MASKIFHISRSLRAVRAIALKAELCGGDAKRAFAKVHLVKFTFSSGSWALLLSIPKLSILN
jgi:hypothetical protein